MFQKLIFIKTLNEISDSSYVYRFDFGEDEETAWGEHWNDTPAAIIPDIHPERNTISESYRVELPFKLELASENTCFSMQDCKDGIIALGFTNISNEIRLKFNFADEFDDVMEKLTKYGNGISQLKLDEGDNAVTSLIDELGGEGDE